jgi:hypothetical protein
VVPPVETRYFTKKCVFWAHPAVPLSRFGVMWITAETGVQALNRALAKFHECAMFRKQIVKSESISYIGGKSYERYDTARN